MKLMLSVPDISCQHCAEAITRTLRPQAGVRDVQVDVAQRRVRLDVDEQQLPLDRIKQLLADEEYPVDAVTAA